MLAHLATLLKVRSILTHFDPSDNQVWCYAHTIDLSCKAVVANLHNSEELSDSEGEKRNPVALASQVVRAIRGSSNRREAFKAVIDNGNQKGWFKENGQTIQLKHLQLLRYVRTRWDSCFRMLSRLREMRPVSCFTRHYFRLLLNFYSTGDRPLPCAPGICERSRSVQDI